MKEPDKKITGQEEEIVTWDGGQGRAIGTCDRDVGQGQGTGTGGGWGTRTGEGAGGRDGGQGPLAGAMGAGKDKGQGRRTGTEDRDGGQGRRTGTEDRDGGQGRFNNPIISMLFSKNNCIHRIRFLSYRFNNNYLYKLSFKLSFFLHIDNYAKKIIYATG